MTIGYYPRYEKNGMNTLSAVCNTVIILTFGNLYKAIASALNDWENHRTQVQYEDAHITKTFMFDFVNNYFILFYIGYLRSIKDPFVGADGRGPQGHSRTALAVFCTDSPSKDAGSRMNDFTARGQAPTRRAPGRPACPSSRARSPRSSPRR